MGWVLSLEIISDRLQRIGGCRVLGLPAHVYVLGQRRAGVTKLVSDLAGGLAGIVQDRRGGLPERVRCDPCHSVRCDGLCRLSRDLNDLRSATCRCAIGVEDRFDLPDLDLYSSVLHEADSVLGAPNRSRGLLLLEAGHLPAFLQRATEIPPKFRADRRASIPEGTAGGRGGTKTPRNVREDRRR